MYISETYSLITARRMSVFALNC